MISQGVGLKIVYIIVGLLLALGTELRKFLFRAKGGPEKKKKKKNPKKKPGACATSLHIKEKLPGPPKYAKS